jgi:hypothetical protein
MDTQPYNIIDHVKGLTPNEIDYAFEISSALIGHMAEVFLRRPESIRPIAITAGMANALSCFAKQYENQDEPPIDPVGDAFPILSRMELTHEDRVYAFNLISSLMQFATDALRDIPPGTTDRAVTAAFAEVLSSLRKPAAQI